MNEGYRGPVTLLATGIVIEVNAELAGRVEPVDGRFHWGGRLSPDDAVVGALKRGVRTVGLQIGDGPQSPARLAEVDPWGGVRVTAVGAPPWREIDTIVENA